MKNQNNYFCQLPTSFHEYDPGIIRRRREERERRRWRERNYRSISNGSVFDERGRELLGRWLNGTGNELRTHNGPWGEYMRQNHHLRTNVLNQLQIDNARRTSSGPIYMRFHNEIENGYNTGYQMLHGTHSIAGNFEIQGNATVLEDKTVYNLRLTWHDIIDPNATYPEDSTLAYLLYILYDPRDYSVHISWDQIFAIIRTNKK